MRLGGDDNVEKECDCEEVNIGSSAVAGVVYSIAANGEPCELRIILFWLVANNYAAVCDILLAVYGNTGLTNEENCVGAFNLARYSFRELS